MQYQQVLIPTDDDVRLSGDGYLQEFVISRIAASRDPLLLILWHHHRFPTQQDEADDGLNVQVGQPVFVANARPVEDVNQFFQQRLSVEQDIVTVAQGAATPSLQCRRA